MRKKPPVERLEVPIRELQDLLGEAREKLGADGYWQVADVPIPYPGRWHMRIEALVTDFRKVTLEDDFDVPQRASGR